MISTHAWEEFLKCRAICSALEPEPEARMAIFFIILTIDG